MKLTITLQDGEYPPFVGAVVSRWLADGFIPSAFGVLKIADIKVEEAKE